MSMRILMVGDNLQQLAIDKEVLKERKFRVYICTDLDLVGELIDEIKPEVVFLNPSQPTDITNDLYHYLMDNIKKASLPIVYTLAEDDVYLVNRKRTSFKENRNVMADNMIDALKIAMTHPAPNWHKTTFPLGKSLHLPNYASRA